MNNSFYSNIVYLDNASYAKISDNSVYKNGTGDGIWIVAVDKFEITNNYITNTSGVGVRADAACTNTYGKMNRFDTVSVPYFGGGIRYDSSTQVPNSGTWSNGDIVWNTTPPAGGTPGWVCVTSGTPGTWKAMANLAV